MNTTTEKLAKKKGTLAVSIMRFNKFRGKIPDSRILVVEGDDDPVFYSTAFRRLGLNDCDIFFTAYGKDNVLGLRDYLLRSKEAPKSGQTLYFIDKDFDGLKGMPAGGDIYITPGYSIENIVVCKSALRQLLLSRFKLSEEETFDDVARILAIFDKLIEQHKSELEEANRIIHFVRKQTLAGETYTSGSINDVTSKFADISHADMSIKQVATGNDLLSLISVCKVIDATDFERLKDEFESLDPAKEWRGKFLFFLFRRFVGILSEDRNSKTPRFFSKGNGKVALDTSPTSFIGLLASLCEIPDCLGRFMGDITAEPG